MFSIGQRAAIPAPPVQIKRERAYHPRTYSEFVKGLKNGELPEVMIKPNQNLAVFEDNEGNYGDVQIIQNQDLWQIRVDLKNRFCCQKRLHTLLVKRRFFLL